MARDRRQRMRTGVKGGIPCPVAAAYCKWLAAAGAAGAGGWALMTAARGNAYYSGPVSDHFDGTRFFNPGGIEPKGRLDFLRWQLTERGAPGRRASRARFRPTARPRPCEGEAVRIAYVGHASSWCRRAGATS